MTRGRFKKVWTYLLLVVSLLASFVLSVYVGSSGVLQHSEIIDFLTSYDPDSFKHAVISERIVRSIFSIVAGASLATSGSLLQAVSKNPIADSGLLGINNGASLAVVLGISFLDLSKQSHYMSLAILGGVFASVLVYKISSIGRLGLTPVKLVLSGAAVSMALSSFVTMVALPKNNVLQDLRFWQVGSLGASEWESLKLILPFVLVGLFLAILLGPSLNILALGDEAAIGLGVKVVYVRVLGILVSVILSATITSVAGPIGFVGLVVPHLVRVITGDDNERVIPISMLVGAIYLTLCDVLARVIARPRELEVGLVTTFIGGPILVYIVLKEERRRLND